MLAHIHCTVYCVASGKASFLKYFTSLSLVVHHCLKELLKNQIPIILLIPSYTVSQPPEIQ